MSLNSYFVIQASELSVVLEMHLEFFTDQYFKPQIKKISLGGLLILPSYICELNSFWESLISQNSPIQKGSFKLAELYLLYLDI